MKQILRTCTVMSIIFPLDLHGVFLCLITWTTFYLVLQLIGECFISPFVGYMFLRVRSVSFLSSALLCTQG